MKYSILITDEDEDIHKYLQNLLEDNFNIYKAYSSEDALNILSEHEVNLMISEIDLPDLDGFELLYKVKNISPKIDFIFYTSEISLDNVLLALRGGASDYINKIQEKSQILTSIKSIINKTKPKSPSIKNDDILQNHMVSKSFSMVKVMELVNQVSSSNATIMLNGETGTGKSVMAEIIHKLSSRSKKPLIKVNCAAIPEQLLESELFGYEKGAFTGAVATKPGRFELANGGTLFLDEIGDISPFMQVKLLRILQEKEFEHLGGIKTIKVDVRVITATNKNLIQMVKNGTFREDLYYRLNVVPINLPSLRERKEDILDLINYFLLQTSKQSGEELKSISKEALGKLVSYNWPGNIRELENAIERCIVITPGNNITIDNLPSNIANFSNKLIDKNIASSLTLQKEIVEKEEILRILNKCNNNITKASEVLCISRRTLHRKINKYNL